MQNPSITERLALPSAIASMQATAEYWKATLSDAPGLLELPTDHARPARQDHAGARVEVELGEELSAGLEALSRRHGATLDVTLLAGWAVVLSRLSGQGDLVIGTPGAGREPRETKGPAGLAAHTLAIRVDLSGAPTVAELLERVKERTFGARHHQDIPFEEVAELLRPARSLSNLPLFQVMFAWQNASASRLELRGLSLAPVDAAPHVTDRFDLLLSLGEDDGRIAGGVEYATALFERDAVERWVGYLRRVLEGMVADERRSVQRLELLPDAERRQVVEEWNATDAAFPADACVHQLFEAQVERTPGAAALVWEDETLSYAELNARANRLAHHLLALGVGPDARVALCVERGVELVVGMLAVLKAGGAYVPLDPSYPDERLRYMLADSRPAVLLASPSQAERFAGSGVPILDPADAGAWAHHPPTDPRPAGLSAEHLCYVIYTSGSTGRPKGVAVPHRGVVNLAGWHQRAYGVTPADRATQFASPAFDAAAWETWPYLAAGAELHLLSDAVRADPASVLDYFSRARITLAFLPTPVAEAVLDEIDRGGAPTLFLRALLTGGDALHRGPGAAPFRLVNHYGPTESSVVSTAAEVPADCAGAPPIGVPIDNQAGYVLDGWMNPVPVGVAGELYVGGAGLARGYLGRPALTAERFVPDPFGRAPGGRLYRTGDRVRWNASGKLEFLGRLDFQVKVRGFRIELGEIEAGVRGYPAVRDALVVAREDAPGDRRLVAYYLAHEPVAVDALRAHLLERLPEHMVPAAYVWMERFPLTPNGKVDRKALPAPEGDAFPARGYEAPAGTVEEAVASIWAELLGAERVGRRDHFFELGGHSLLAMRVVSRVRQALGLELSPRDLFERPALADFARGLSTAARAEEAGIVPADRSAPIPLSFAQQRLWFLEQLGNLGSTYHISMHLRLRGDLDRGALARALDRIVARHEALRTSFPTVDGEPVQRISSIEESAFRVVEDDLHASPDAEEALRRLMMAEASAPFDLEQGPLIRGRLVRMAADDHALLLTIHHIVSDGWSMGVFFDELSALYAAFTRGEPDPLPPLPVQYADYAAWQRRWVEGDVLQAQAAYWTETLAGAPELLELPADHPRPARQDFAGASLKVELDEALTASLKALGQRHGATLYMTLLAGWAAVLSRLSGQDEVVVGTPSANRGHAEVEELIGFFVNTLPVRVDLSGAPTVAEALGRVKARALEAQANQDIPFEQVVERVRPARSLAHTPLFQVMFAWQNVPASRLELPGLSLAPADSAPHGTAKFDLLLSLSEDDGQITGEVEYATALFEPATVERYVGYLRRVLEAMAADDAKPVGRLDLLSAAERRRVVEEWNATDAGYPAGACVHELFAAQVARTPEAVALSWRGQRLTYARLDEQANRLANALRRRGVGPEVRVGICLPRTPELVAAMLGVLKAGGVYVPLDPAYPRERLGYMQQDAGVTLVITDSSLADRLPANAAALLLLDRERDAIAAEPKDAPESGVGPENLSHVIFTSGSTGRPKGVMIRHSSVVILLHWLRENVTDEERSAVLFSTSINFDVSIAEIFGTLAWGGKLVLVENALELATLEEEVVHASMVPSAAAELLRSGGIPASVKTLNLGGEALPTALAQGLYALGTVEKVGNLYGPTEDTTYSTYYVVPRGAEQVLVGTPVANTQAYVLDAHLQPVPVGTVGELYLAGDGLSRGYANRPAMTAERFVPCPFGRPGARMYRVMDRVRRRADGELEYLGRTDFQVKVRGYRIELGEIEARLAEHPAVRAPVVVVREDVPGDRRLVAYYLADEPVEVDALKSHLANRLPGYMVPAAYVWMERLPLTQNGKVDRAALPAPAGDAYAAREYEAPLGHTEQAVAAIWAQVLGAERVGRGDNFFERGGHSLLAVRVVSRVRQVLGVEARPADLFERPVLADFARGLETAARAEATAVTPVDRTAEIPLSFAQQRLWFLEQLGGMGAAYHVPMSLRLRGVLDRGALVRALNRIVARHEALRTTFPVVDGEPVQHIAPVEESAFHLVEHDLSGILPRSARNERGGGRGEGPDAHDELRRLAAGEASAPFVLSRGPLIRGRLVRMAADDHQLLLTMHHIVSDGWSLGVLYRELGALYAAFARGEPDPLPPLPVQYADYAVWHRRWVEGEVLRRQADYWRQTLAGAPELLELPADHPRPARQDFAGASLRVELDEGLTAALKTLGQRHGATLYMTLLAGWAAVLSRLSGQDEVVVGTPSANRGGSEIEGLIGFFVNTLPVRVDLSGAPTVAEALGRVKARALEAQAHQDIPFEQVVELVQPARSLAHSPLFQVMFAWHNVPLESLELPGLSLAEADAAPHVTAKFDLLLSLSEDDGRIVGEVEYATALFERETVERWLGYLRRMLEAFAAHDGLAIDHLPMLAEAERRQVLREWNATEAAYPRQACVHELVEAQVERTPGATAVVFEGERVTYADLNARANRLAHHLRSLGVGPDTRVGICVERSVEMVVGLLGILKAGGAYVPLDSSYPVDRLRFMLEDSAPAVLLTHPPQAATAAALSAGSAIPVLDLTADEAWAEQPETNPGRDGLGPRNLGHVLFTSGSTGRPKGVMLEHGSLVNRLAWMQDRYGMTADEVLLQKTPFSFDVSFCEFFWPLMVGARVVMARPDGHRDPAYLVETIQREGITHAHFVPSMLQLFLEHPEAAKCTGLLRVPVSGEAVSMALVRQFHQRLPGVELTNQYGPTESGEVTEWACDPDAERVSIGRAIHNSTVYVLDRTGQPAPVGVAGELFIGGVAVARGYLGRPRLTAERFVPDPFGEPGARMYRTGDLCRWMTSAKVRECESAPDAHENELTFELSHSRTAVLEYLGRTDFQVKVRGFRVEPGEIEARLAAHPGVREAVVLALDDGAGGKRLVAYFVGEALESEALRAHLAEQLPEYMVPAAFVRLEALPLNPNGKLDRKALPAPDTDAFAARAYEAPVGETETALAAIWSELLGIERIGRRDNFFDLGGHSLLAVRVVSRVRQVLGVEASISDLFVRPVLADFARGLETATRAELPAIVPAEREGPLELSFAQQRLWFIDRMEGAGAAYHLPMRLRLKGELDREALLRALERIVARHEALRTSFPETDGVPTQRIAAVQESPFRLAEHDLEGRPDAPRELDRLVVEEAEAPFDLARGPLVRGRLIRLASNDHVLLVTMHHIVSDGWSLGIFTRELSALYAAFRGGSPDPLPPLPVQYADYAAWQRRWVEGEVLRRQADYWRETLSGAPELLELPTDRPRPARQNFAGAWMKVELDETLTTALRTLGQRHGATLHMTLLAGWAAVLARLSGQDEVVVGTPSANRGRSEIEGLIGFFVNTLALRVDLSGAPTVAELLGRVKERSLGAQQNQDIPFEQVVELVQPARSLAHTPLFQVLFAWQNAPESRLELPGLAVDLSDSGDVSSQVAAKFDLSLGLWEDGGRIKGVVDYATALFERETVERWLVYLRRVLEEMAADDAKPVSRLDLLGEAERAGLLALGEGATPELPRATVDALFAQAAAAAPGAVALAWDGGRMTYAELDVRANRLAHHLRRSGVTAGTRVGVCLERGPELVVATLAALKAGGAYVPLDPTYPAERLAYMLADTVVPVLVTESRLADRLPPHAAHIVRVDTDAAAIAAESSDVLVSGTDPEAAAYVMYTSGSTGRPKGVEVPHRAIVRLLRGQDYLSIDSADVFLQLAPASFDAATLELWGPLLNGARLAIHPAEQPSVESIGRALAEHGVTILWLTAGLFHLVVDERIEILRGVRQLLAGGDVLSVPHVRRVLAELPGTALINGYGPTENTTFTCCHRIAEARDGASIPVGRPIANTYVRVLDTGMQPVPVGVPGELYAGGAGLALGYLNQPELTAEKFVADPFAPGARLYRTGDRVRWRADGTVEFLGRVDTQVKVRGFRVEPGEIEARLLEHAGVQDAVVTVREDAPGDRRLVAYYVADEPAAVDALKSHLASRLPGYMVPAAYVWMERLPLTPNGKVDYRALPAPEGDAYAIREYEAPLGATEEVVAGIWAELLGAERVGRRDHFFELGGHSLLAVRVVSRVRQALGVEAEIGDLFVRPVLADFARGLEAAARAEAPAITPVDRTGNIPLSFAQQRLWLLERLGDLGSTYHIPAQLRLKGELDRDALAAALDRIVARHEALRTTFAEVNGVPQQRIAPTEASGFTLIEHDLSGQADAEAELGRLMAEETGARFDLEHGPLIRGRLIRLAADDHVLLVTMHHIVSDGWSMGVLFGELSAFYAAHAQGREAGLAGLPVQYADYAAWQREWIQGELLERQTSYWEQTLAGAPELLELPTDRARPQKQDFTGGSVDIGLDEDLTAALKALSQRHGATLFMTLLVGWATVLARLSGQDDVVVGTPSANRGQREIEELIGFFVNTLALRVELSGAPTVAELLQRVRTRALEAQRHQDVPFEQVVERMRPVRSLAHTPLFQVVFAWQNATGGALELPGLIVDAGAAETGTAKFDLTLTLWENGGRIAGTIEYATALFDRATVERHAGYLRRVLEEMAADESQPVSRLPLLPDAERRLVLEDWNATDRPYPAGTCVHEMFRAQAARTPHAVAISWRGERVTYAELEARANRLANALRRLGVGPEVRVGICLPRTPELVAGMLGVLGAGGAYVPLDPAYPRERLGYMLEDAGVALVITDSGLEDRLPEGAASTLLLDHERDTIAAESTAAPESGVVPENLSHVIFTSGSTGRPKGVMIRHSSVVVLLHWLRENVTDEERSAVLFSTSINFDVSIAEVFGTLAWGGKLVLVENALELATLEENVVHVSMVPSAAAELLRSGGIPRSVKTLNLGGEALPNALAQGLYALGTVQKVGNLYGPTEDTTYSTYYVVPRGAEQVLVGTPVANTRAYVLDRHLQPVPVGTVGELYLAGDGLSRGYANHPGMTAERFVPCPFGVRGARMYRVMDRVRRRVDGKIEYLGRTDFQVKVRGYRIEPGEIEARLREHPAVRQAVVLAREDTPGDRRLVAYVVGDETAGAEALRAHLGQTLPAYMVPAAYVRLEQLPLTPNGKLDRAALPAPEGDAYAAREYEAPVGKVEQALADIWVELLGVERVGRGDDFFLLGGHSILAVQMISRVQKVMQVELALAAVFETPVLAALADRILDLRLARFDPETMARLAQLVREPGAETT